LQSPERGRNVARNSGLHAAGQREVGMIEGVEHLHIKAQRTLFPEVKPAREIDVGVGEMRAADGVSAGVAELAEGWCVRPARTDSSAVAGGWIDHGDKCVGVEPLPSGEGDSGYRGFLVERLAENARKLGEWLKRELERLAKNYPGVVKNARGLGFMLGLELAEKIPAFASSDKSAAIQMTNRLQQAGVLVIPAGTQVIRLLPPLNLKPQEAGEGIAKIEEVVKSLA